MICNFIFIYLSLLVNGINALGKNFLQNSILIYSK
jgi:hypothetical protein